VQRVRARGSWLSAKVLAPAPDAVVHLHGGPGIGIVEQVALTSTYFEGLRTRRDVVAFDQRGVDTSAGRETRCLATLADHVTDLAGTVKPADEPANLPPALTRACLDELAASGADLSKINTEQNARDVQAVMRALGYPVCNVYGLSYGTKPRPPRAGARRRRATCPAARRSSSPRPDTAPWPSRNAPGTWVWPSG